MKFYKLDEVPVYRDDQVFKVSPVGKAIATVIMFGLAIACLVAAMSGTKPLGIGTGPYYIFTAVIGLFGLIPFSMLRASLRPTAWLARCGTTGLIIKYRSYQNWKLGGDGPQAVGLDYSEIAWARLVKERRTKPSMDSRIRNETSFVTYVEMGLVNPDTSELERRLAEDRNVQPEGKMVTMDYPVQALENGVVQISWADGINPSAHKAVETLGKNVKTLEVEHRVTDLTHHRGADPDQERAKIVALAKGGEQMEAVKLAQRVYGYNLSQAMEFVENIQKEG